MEGWKNRLAHWTPPWKDKALLRYQRQTSRNKNTGHRSSQDIPTNWWRETTSTVCVEGNGGGGRREGLVVFYEPESCWNCSQVLVRSRQFSWWQSTRMQVPDTHHNQHDSRWTRVGRLRHTFAYTAMTTTIWETGDNCISLIPTDVNIIHTWGGRKKLGKHRVESCLACIYIKVNWE